MQFDFKMSFGDSSVEVSDMSDAFGRPGVCYMTMDHKGISIQCPGAFLGGMPVQRTEPAQKPASKGKKPAPKPAPQKKVSGKQVLDMITKPTHIADPHRPPGNMFTSI